MRRKNSIFYVQTWYLKVICQRKTGNLSTSPFFVPTVAQKELVNKNASKLIVSKYLRFLESELGKSLLPEMGQPRVKKIVRDGECGLGSTTISSGIFERKLWNIILRPLHYCNYIHITSGRITAFESHNMSQIQMFLFYWELIYLWLLNNLVCFKS